MLKEIIEFSKLIGKLKKIERTGWVTGPGIKNPESVADHTFRTVALAMVIADIKKLDAEKMMRMALLHDLGEAITGDFDFYAKKRFTADEIEQKEGEAILRILSTLPGELRSNYLEIWKEYRKQETTEARFVKEIDRIEMIFQAWEYEKEGYDKERLERFWEKTKPLIRDPDIKKLFELLAEQRD